VSTRRVKNVKGGQQDSFDEFNIAYDRKSGTFKEYTVKRLNFFDQKPKVRKAGPMSERRMLAAARLIRMQHGIKKEEVR